MRRGRWPPFALVTPLLGLLGLWQLWPLEGESLFVFWLGLPKTWHFTQHPSELLLYTSVFLAVEQHSMLRAGTFLLVIVPLCPLGMGTDSGSCLAIYQGKQIPWALLS